MQSSSVSVSKQLSYQAPNKHSSESIYSQASCLHKWLTPSAIVHVNQEVFPTVHHSINRNPFTAYTKVDPELWWRCLLCFTANSISGLDPARHQHLCWPSSLWESKRTLQSSFTGKIPEIKRQDPFLSSQSGLWHGYTEVKYSPLKTLSRFNSCHEALLGILSMISVLKNTS